MAQGRAIYLDHNAGAKLRPAVADAMRELIGQAGNASSVHAPGRAARAQIETARSAVAALAGVEAANVVFTSGATEANVMALSPVWVDGRGSRSFDRLLVGACEHPSVLSGGRFAADAVETLAVDGQGRIDIARLSQRLGELVADGRSVLVSVMAANNETGVIQPLEQIGQAVHEVGATLHVDAVQAAGRIPLDLARWQADSVALSAHKIGGPQGAGALVLRNAGLHPAPLLTGGGQERRKRAGTENVLAIAGFGVAARIALDEIADWERLGVLRDGLERDLLHIRGETCVFGQEAPRLANTSCFAAPGMPAETVLIALDLEGIAVSSGAACSSGKVSSSHVLAAMGVDRDLARCALRVSLGPDTDAEEIEAFVAAWRRVSARMGTAGAGRAA
jgi:cysteine desulfurase